MATGSALPVWPAGPISSCSISAPDSENNWFEQHANPQWYPKGQYVTSDKDGRFSLKNLAAGTWILVTPAKDQQSRIPGPLLTLGQDEEKKDVRLALGEGGAARIQLLDAATQKNAMASMIVECVNADGFKISAPMKEVDPNAADRRKHWQPATDRDGRISFGGLPPGHYRVFATTDVYPIAGTEFEVRAGETTDVQLKLARGGRLGFRLDPGVRRKGASYSVGYRLRKPESGEPVLTGAGGPTLGSIIFFEADKPEAFVPLSPGEYQLEAVLRMETRPGSISATTDLWQASQSVKIEPGKDLIIAVTPKN